MTGLRVPMTLAVILTCVVALAACATSPPTEPGDSEVAQAEEDWGETAIAMDPLIDPLDLLTATLPSVCVHPAGTMVDGSLPDIPEGHGGAGLHITPDDLAELKPENTGTELAFGDRAELAVVAVVGCNAGGVPWPNYIVAWDESLEVVGSVDLGSIGVAGRAVAQQVRVDGDTVLVRWITTGPGDGGCCATVSAEAEFTVDEGEELRMNHLVEKRGEAQTQAFLDAAWHGRTIDADEADEDVAIQLTRLIELGREYDPDSVSCPGGQLAGGEVDGREMPLIGEVGCWVELDTGELLGIGLTVAGWDSYRVESVMVG